MATTSRRQSSENIFMTAQEIANVGGHKKPKAEEPVTAVVEDAVATVPEKKPVETKPVASAPVQEGSVPDVTLSAEDMTNILKVREKGHGINRTVYIDKDVFDVLNSISQKYGLPFSKVINYVLKTGIENQFKK